MYTEQELKEKIANNNFGWIAFCILLLYAAIVSSL